MDRGHEGWNVRTDDKESDAVDDSVSFESLGIKTQTMEKTASTTQDEGDRGSKQRSRQKLTFARQAGQTVAVQQRG